MGAGRPTVIDMPNNLARGVREADLRALGMSRDRFKRQWRDLLPALTAAAGLAGGIAPAWERLVSERLLGDSKLLARLRPLVIGLLVRAAGKVKQIGTDWFYIDDGSNLDDGTGNNGIYVYVGLSIVRPNTNKNVIVTGISSCEILPGSPVARRILRPRRQGDIRVL